MSRAETVCSADVGKPLVDSTGATLGRITDVHRGVTYVALRPTVPDVVAEALGRVDGDATEFPLQPHLVRAVSTDAVRVDRET